MTALHSFLMILIILITLSRYNSLSMSKEVYVNDTLALTWKVEIFSRQKKFYLFQRPFKISIVLQSTDSSQPSTSTLTLAVCSNNFIFVKIVNWWFMWLLSSFHVQRYCSCHYFTVFKILITIYITAINTIFIFHDLSFSI